MQTRWQSGHDRQQQQRWTLFVLAFLAVFAALQWSYSLCRSNGPVERLLVHALTARPSMAVINAITPAEQVRAMGHRLISPRVRLSILNGCEGVEAFFLLFSAIIAYRAPLSRKLKGILLGSLLIFTLNTGRVASLFYALRYQKSLFGLLHGYVWPALIILAGGLFFLKWSAWGVETKR